MNIQPMYDRVLLRREEASNQSAGGLYIPPGAQEKSNIAEVIAIGPGRLTESGDIVALKVEPGMKVLIGKWEGTEVKVDGKDHLMVRETDILAVVA